MKDICILIKELADYGVRSRLVEKDDVTYTVNRLLELFGIDEYKADSEVTADISDRSKTYDKGDNKQDDLYDGLHDILKEMLDYAVGKGLIEDSGANRDLFDTKIMGLLTPPPSVVRKRFKELYESSPKEATDYYYDFSKATDYIRTDRIKKDEKWSSDTEFGTIDITINLSKPEKDPRDIAKAGTAKKSGYPACLLCRENEGYAGHLSHPARQNHRIVPVTLCGEQYYLQYSPYVYYNEHCIIFNHDHIPMRIDRMTFAKLFDFVRQFPHYNVGSNADLPIVGGSILSHDHFQGGNYEFPMARAVYESEFGLKGYDSVHAGRIKWPLSAIRLQGKDIDKLVDASDHILTAWRAYSDEEAFIFAYTDENGKKVPHNTITPIVRMRGDMYEIDLTLRNNITTDRYPLGVYHPHQEYHHIKKENIGLIEVMGLAILPARLKKEMAVLKEAILEGKDLREDELTASHADWAEQWMKKYDGAYKDNIDVIIRDEIAEVFSHVLENAGVYKRDEKGIAAFDRFIASL
ncbi:MAG: UDP-glucose--hexose-1-phosphate uridylyltransferase [Lachnospiraceae bacterium]|nr:UDP-glucose--hexose-1-phosphate uridylyltransferase [Lachnospiraceae bacterium]